MRWRTQPQYPNPGRWRLSRLWSLVHQFEWLRRQHWRKRICQRGTGNAKLSWKAWQGGQCNNNISPNVSDNNYFNFSIWKRRRLDWLSLRNGNTSTAWRPRHVIISGTIFYVSSYFQIRGRFLNLNPSVSWQQLTWTSYVPLWKSSPWLRSKEVLLHLSLRRPTKY